jgi:hypothetical protein
MMEENPTTMLPDTPAKRPSFLTVLCILTFIWSGWNMASNLVVGSFFDFFSKFFAQFAETYKIPGMEILGEATPVYFFVSALFFLGCIIGAFLMWRLKKTGFHVYTISQILLLIAPMYFFRLPGPSWIEVLFSGVFILLYSSNIKQMNP